MRRGWSIREPPTPPSSWRAEEGLESYLTRRSVVAIAGVDSRRLTRLLREKGAQAGCILAGEEVDEESALSCGQGVSRARGDGPRPGGEHRRRVRIHGRRVGMEPGAGPLHRVASFPRGVSGRRLRLRRKAQHPSPARRQRMRGQGGARGNPRGRGARAPSAWRIPLQRPRRPGGVYLCDRGDPGASGSPSADLRHLPRPPAPRDRGWCAHPQDEVRSPWSESSGAGSGHGGSSDNEPESRVRGQ